MIRRLPLLLALFLLPLLGCETALDVPAELSVEARTAMEVLPANAQLIARLDARKTFSSPVGPLPMGELPPDAQAELDAFIEATGLNPETDIDEVFVTIEDLEQEAVSAVVYADYDTERLEAYIATKAEGTMERTTYRDVPLYLSTDAARPGALALVEGDMILAGSSRQLVEGMIDRLAGEGQALATDTEAMQMISMAAGNDAWAVVRGLTFPEARPADTSDDAQAAQMAQIGRAIQHAVVSYSLDQSEIHGTARLYPQTNISADDLAALTRGLLAAAKADQNLAKDQRDLLDDIDIDARGDLVLIKLEVPMALINR